MCVRVCVHACVRACARVHVCTFVRAHACVSGLISIENIEPSHACSSEWYRAANRSMTSIVSDVQVHDQVLCVKIYVLPRFKHSTCHSWSFLKARYSGTNLGAG